MEECQVQMRELHLPSKSNIKATAKRNDQLLSLLTTHTA